MEVIIERMSASVERMSASIARMEARIARMEARVARMEARVARMEARVARLLASFEWREGNGEPRGEHPEEARAERGATAAHGDLTERHWTFVL